MSDSGDAKTGDEQNQEKKSKQKKPDQGKEKSKTKILKSKETVSQADSIRERTIKTEAQITSLQHSNIVLSQQINNLTIQNAQLLNELAALKNQKLLNLNNDPSINQVDPMYMQSNIQLQPNAINDIQKLQKTILSMQEKHQQELAFRDDLIERMRANIQLNTDYPSYNDVMQKNQYIQQQQIKQQENTKKNLSKKKRLPQNNIIYVEGVNHNLSSKVPNSPSDQQILEQKYLKKKNKLILLKQQYEELEVESRNKINKTKENLEDVKQKFQLLKKKYVELKEDFSSLQSCYQAVVQKAEALSSELQNANNPSKNRHQNNDFPPITIEKHISHTKMVKSDEKNSKEKSKYHEMKKRAEKAEEDATQLRYLLKILSSNEKNFNKLNFNNQNIIDQLNSLGIKIDRLERKNGIKNDYPPQTKKVIEYQESYTHKRQKENEYPVSYSPQRNKMKARKSSNSPQRIISNDIQDSYSPHGGNSNVFNDSFSSPKKRSSSAKKDTRKFPQWRQFQDF